VGPGTWLVKSTLFQSSGIVFQFPLFPPEPVHFLPVFPPLRSLAPVKAPAKEKFVYDQDAGKGFIQIVGPALGVEGRVELLFTVIFLEKEGLQTSTPGSPTIWGYPKC